MVELIKIALGFLQQIWSFFFSPRYYCWQTLIWLALFSTVISALATGFVRHLISTLGYAFLIVGLAWAGSEQGLVLTPWIVSAMLLHLLSGLLPAIAPSVGVVLWLPLAGAIASLPQFFDRHLTFHLPNAQQRQAFLILMGSQVLVACWLQFAIALNHWLARYPSLLADDFSRSFVVMRVESLQPESARAPRGELVLEVLRPLLEERIESQSWPLVRQSLAAETWNQTELPELRRRTLDRLAARPGQNLPENPLWQVTAQVEPREGGYRLAIAAEWQGPTSQAVADGTANPYRAVMICQVESRDTPGAIVTGSRVSCITPEERRQLLPDTGF